MPKWRKLHVKALESEDIHDMPDDFTRLMWVLLPLVLDREGRGRRSGAWLRSKVFPLRTDVTVKQVDEAMTWFVFRLMIRVYEVDGRFYFWVPSFARYQGDTTKEAESDYPPPPESDDSDPWPTPELVETKSGVGPELVESRSGSDSDSDSDSDSSLTGAAIAAPLAPPKRKRASRADPRTAHPAIQAYRTACGGRAFPKRELYDKIIGALGDEPDLPRLTECRQEWIARGFKAVNYAWLFEWYRDGIPTNGNGARASPANQLKEEKYDWLGLAQHYAEVRGDDERPDDGTG